MQILDPTTGLQVTVHLATARSSSRNMVPAFPNNLCVLAVRNDSDSRKTNGILRWSSGNALVNKNNDPLLCHSYRIHHDRKSARIVAGPQSGS